MSQILKKVTAASSLAPEDVRPGMYVAVLREKHDHECAIEWKSEFHAGRKSVRYRCVDIPEPSENQPVFVEAVCVPFVLVRGSGDASRVLDLRRVDLIRLKKAFAEFALARMKPEDP
ncbi:MAG: hypothetical protein ACTS27_10040 [Phycisphaerales bacterium]